MSGTGAAAQAGTTHQAQTPNVSAATAREGEGFVGSLASREKVSLQAITQIAGTLLWFAVAVATLSMGLAYFTNHVMRKPTKGRDTSKPTFTVGSS
jgi:hypothetical protein